MIVMFPTKSKLPSISEVGGKGYNLIKMGQGGLQVPPGFVLTGEFFNPWFHELHQTEAWQKFIQHADNIEHLQKICDELKKNVFSFAFDDRQKKELESCLSDYSITSLFAVRSSSPEEDLGGASFAGAYETVLGVIL